MSSNPVKGGVKKRFTRGPTSQRGGNGTIIKYSSLGSSLSTAAGSSTDQASRLYITGNSGGLQNSVGPTLVGYYSTAKFLPGTKIRWEPSCSFNTTGRIYCGFTDNPETASILEGLKTSNAVSYRDSVRGLENVISFPVWQETEVTFPTRTRRKRFDTNINAANNIDVYDRSLQQAFFIVAEGAPASTVLGSFWYHDVVDAEGIQTIVT